MSLLSDIREATRGRTCIVGMGNYMRRDDAVGLYLVDELKEMVRSDRVIIINAEDIIESYAFTVADMDCDSVLVVDAVKTGTEPGSVVFGRLNQYDDLSGDYSTHKLSLKMCGKIWEENGKKTYLLGVQADDLDFWEGMTGNVKRSADLLKEILVETINSEQKEYLYEH